MFVKMRINFIIAAVVILVVGCDTYSRTYKADCSVPPSSFITTKDGIGHLGYLVVVNMSPNGIVRWAGATLTDAEFEVNLKVANGLLPKPTVVFDPDANAPCERVERVREIMVNSLFCRGEIMNCGEGHDPRNWPMADRNSLY